LPVIGVMPRVLGNPAETLADFHATYGDVVRLAPRLVAVFSPDVAAHILVDRERIYHKSAFYKRGRVLIGDGLFLSDGDVWRMRRRMLNPVFHRLMLNSMVGAMVDEAEHLVQHWQRAAGPGVIGVSSAMQQITMRIVLVALLGSDMPPDTQQELAQAVTAALRALGDRINQPLPLPLWVPTALNRQLIGATRVAERIVFELIDRRQAEWDEKRTDLLSVLLTMNTSGEAPLSRKELRDETMSMFLAGHETTAHTMTWLWYMLATHPDVEQKLHDELDQVLGGRLPTAQDLPRLTYTRQVIEETLRLFPALWVISRTVLRDDTLGSYTVPAGSDILISTYHIHRRPDLWQDPERFDPDRFQPELTQHQHPFAFLSFGGGPRRCIGAGFAMTEMQVLVAILASRFRLRLPSGAQVRPSFRGALHPDGELNLLIEARDPSRALGA
jgi:cytochrome P450